MKKGKEKEKKNYLSLQDHYIIVLYFQKSSCYFFLCQFLLKQLC